MTNNFQNKNLHGANDEVEDFFHFGRGKGDVRFFFFFFSNLGKGGNECFFFGSIVKTPSFQ